jgi:hypothetical protein
MSKTAFYANMIKQQLENLKPGLEPHSGADSAVTYILTRLWPDLESAIEQELPNDPK